MKTKIMNWLENHKTVYGAVMVVASLCTAAFAGYRYGVSSTETGNNIIIMNINGYANEAVSKEETK